MDTNTTTNKKTTLTAILPDGTTATRKTARVYTHAIAVRTTANAQILHWTSRLERDTEKLREAESHNPNAIYSAGHTWGERADYYRKCVAEDKAEILAAADRWAVRSWCGRLDLAQKALDREAKYAGRDSLRIVEVVDPRQS
jgi:hypothetical protein